jgi:hypothetical protein
MKMHLFALIEMAAVFAALCRTMMILVMKAPRAVHLIPEGRRPRTFWSTCPSLR